MATDAQHRVAAAISEKIWQEQVEALARAYGWRVYAFQGSQVTAGWPDLALLHPAGDIVFAELKPAKGQLRPAQRETLALLGAVADTYTWRPSDFEAAVNRLSRDIVISPVAENSRDHPTVTAVMEATADEYNTTSSRFLARDRTPKLSEARQVAMYVARNVSDVSLPQLGRAFSRDHSTVSHAIKTVERKLGAEPEIAHRVARIYDALRLPIDRGVHLQVAKAL